MTSLAVLGSTGSIGTQTLDIASAIPDCYEVTAIGAARSVDLLVEQAEQFHPEIVAIADESLAGDLASRVPVGTEVLAGEAAMVEAATAAELVLNAVVGFAGLPITLAALRAGRRLGLANKESLIAAGPVVREARMTPGAELLPVDSEHCAIHQCLGRNGGEVAVDRVILTASGGPFRGYSQERLKEVAVEDALVHPTWSMGPKITVDSSTLMNKGLEVIEAHELFGLDYDQIDVVLHPQSVVHSIVAFRDGASIAQLSHPDMRLCIGYVLAYPERLTLPFGAIDWSKKMHLDFEAPDRLTFPLLDLAFESGRLGGTAPAWLNAANEVAVGAFLEGRLPWVGIAEVICEVMDKWPGFPADSVEAVFDADSRARHQAYIQLDARS